MEMEGGTAAAAEAYEGHGITDQAQLREEEVIKGIPQFEIQCALLQRHVARAYFLENVDLLTAGQYRDVVAERAVAGLCGFPLCPNYLTTAHAVPAQRYRISLREKRVYDVSDRVLFCSDECLVSARLEEVHLRSDSSDPLPPKRGSAVAGQITERAEAGAPSTDFRDTGDVEGYVWGKLLKGTGAGPVHPSRTHRTDPLPAAALPRRPAHLPAASRTSPVAKNDAAKRVKLVGSSSSSGGDRVSRPGMREEEWVSEGPAILQGIMGKRRTVQMIPLEEAFRLVKIQDEPTILAPTPAAPRTQKPSQQQQRPAGDTEDADAYGEAGDNLTSDDDEDDEDEDEDNFMPEPMLSLFAQLWTTLSDWPSSRSRAFLKRSGGSQGEGTAELVNKEADEEEPPRDIMPISDADQERARGRTIQEMLLRELPAVCAQLHISVPLHGTLSRLLETFAFPRPLMFKPQQLRLVLIVLLDVLAACGDDVLRAQIQASDAQKRGVLAARNLSPDEWQLLVELFLG